MYNEQESALWNFAPMLKRFHPALFAHQITFLHHQVGPFTSSSSLSAHLRHRRNIRNARQLKATLIKHDRLPRRRAIIRVGDAVALDGRPADVHSVGPVRGALGIWV